MSGKSGPEKRFAVDVMLGRLAKWLRVLGFDTRVKDFSEKDLVPELLARGLVPVTRREKLRNTDGVVFLSGDRHFDQLKELISKLRLDESDFRVFTRCTACNAPLDPISREAAFGAVPDFVYETASDFRKCPECARVYWPGSHKGRMLEKLASITQYDPWKQEGKDGGQ